MKIFRIFKGFLDSQTYKTSQILSRIVNKLARNATYIFLRFWHMIIPQKCQENCQEQVRKFLGIFFKGFDYNQGCNYQT
jgi:hypothetical protein